VVFNRHHKSDRTDQRLINIEAQQQQILACLQGLLKGEKRIMSQQDEINADVQQLAGYTSDMSTALTAVEAEIAALKTANPALDLTGVTSALDGVKAVHDQLAADVPAPVVPPVV
jgi:hypothetical protein